MDSDWAICRGVLEAIRALCQSKENPVIVELGSGKGTEALTNFGKVYSVEHDEAWILNFEGVDYIHSPLTEINPISGFNHLQWYDSQIMFNHLPSSYDLLLVDGPPGSVGRSGILNHLDSVPDDVIWIIDDTLRTEEGHLSDTIAISKSMLQYRFWNFSILSRMPIEANTIDQIRHISYSVMQEKSDAKIQFFYPGFRGRKVIT
ncbi:MAG: hypothetical protein CMA28_03405 [Euryarchaeota archaeon]|nr:hypothetical protein [Euryarchaeota archaeon]|tara:strand:+ start:492 stop:1103 length:612 start_codon:yes stop_codon:yes gene_type:complete